MRCRVCPKKIVVLLHEKDASFESTSYLLRLMMKKWKDKGLAVEIVRGASRFVPADVIIPHLDLTVTPDEYRDFVDRYPVAINRRVVNISKSKISTNIAGRGDAYAGPVIVKTDRNYGGLPERRLKGETPAYLVPRRIIGKVVSKLRRKRTGMTPWKSVEYMEPGAYPVFSSLQEVPEGVFDNENLVVEKFLPEVEEGNYCLRYYYFFGDKDINILLRSREKIVKGTNVFRCEEAPVPPELYSIRRRMGFDYGKFDYVLRHGEVILFDANRTPSYSMLEPHHLANKVACHLAEGIWSTLELSCS